MKEVLSKKFWQDVKKTFDDALEGPPPKAGDSQTPDANQPSAPPPEKSGEDTGENR